MTGVDARLTRAVLDRYDPAEFPCLWDVIRSKDRPLAGQRLLCGFPIFYNTLALFWALQAAGADLSITEAPGVPTDPDVVAILPSLGLTVTADPTAATYDIVLDCAGALRDVAATLGYVELTKSGEHAYQGNASPVFLIDAGEIKHIETSLGTGDAFVRALSQLGHGDIAERSIVVFGAGKVGMGIADRTAAHGASVTLVDDHTPAGGDRYPRLRITDREAIRSAITSAWCIVSATGVAGALEPWNDDLRTGPALLANMGALDEFGPSMAADRVLNGKEPLNFVLEEPTLLRYIDPSMALGVAGAEELVTASLAPGINVPDHALEERVLAPARRSGRIADDLTGT